MTARKYANGTDGNTNDLLENDSPKQYENVGKTLPS